MRYYYYYCFHGSVAETQTGFQKLTLHMAPTTAALLCRAGVAALWHKTGSAACNKPKAGLSSAAHSSHVNINMAQHSTSQHSIACTAQPSITQPSTAMLYPESTKSQLSTATLCPNLPKAQLSTAGPGLAQPRAQKPKSPKIPTKQQRRYWTLAR